MTAIKDMKKSITHDIAQVRNCISYIEKISRSQEIKKVCVAWQFMEILKHHLLEGDLTTQNIHATLEKKHAEFLKSQQH